MAGKGGCPLLMDRNHESKTKKVDGEAHPASDFAYVPDPEKPSTWKLPIFNMRHVGGALAAMTSDYRGKPFGDGLTPSRYRLSAAPSAGTPVEMKDIPTLPTLLADTAGYFTYGRHQKRW